MKGDLFQAAMLAVKLQEARDTLRGVLRADYDAKIKPWREAVRKIAATLDGNPLTAAIKLCSEPRIAVDGFAQLYVLAAACDESETKARPATGADKGE